MEQAKKSAKLERGAPRGVWVGGSSRRQIQMEAGVSEVGGSNLGGVMAERGPGVRKSKVDAGNWRRGVRESIVHNVV